MHTYNDQIHKAISFTTSLGASVPTFSFHGAELLTEDNSAKVLDIIRAHGITSFAPSVGQCLKWSHALLPLVARAMNCDILLTIGQLHLRESVIYGPTEGDFSRWYANGFRKSDFQHTRGLNLHAWYTLPSGEILDLTIWSTMGTVWQRPEMVGSVVGGYPDLLAPLPTYIPIVVGCDYVETLEERTGGELLSRSLSMSELSRLPMLYLR